MGCLQPGGMKHVTREMVMSIAGGFMRRPYGIAFAASATRFTTARIAGSAPDFTRVVGAEGAIVESIPSN